MHTYLCSIVLLSAVWTNPVFGKHIKKDPKNDIVFLQKNETFVWNSTQYGNPYPNQSLDIFTDSKYYILATINNISLDSNNGDYLLVKWGLETEKEVGGKVWIREADSKIEYVIKSNRASFYFSGGNSTSNRSKFMITVKNIEILGEPQKRPLPKCSDESILFGGYVSGYEGLNFADNKTVQDLKYAIGNMTVEYCKINNLVPRRNVTHEDICMKYTKECPIFWANREHCALILFSVETEIYNNPSCTNCFLSQTQMKAMWTLLAEDYLTKYQLSPYKQSDNFTTMKFWITIFSFFLIVMTCCMFMMKKCRKMQTASRSKDVPYKSNTFDINRSLNDYSLDPHPLQQVPPFFESVNGVKSSLPSYSSAMGLSDEEDGHEDVVFQRNSDETKAKSC